MGFAKSRLVILALVVLALGVFPSCSKEGKEKDKGKDGGTGSITVISMTRTATVQAIDPVKHTVTLKSANGLTKTYKLSEDVTNFDQIKVNDRVNATLVESIAVFVRKVGTPPDVREGATVALAPKGSRPGIVLADTVEATAKIMDVDLQDRTITIKEVTGKPKTLKVGPQVNLTNLVRGDDVVVQATEALAILVEKPRGAK
jgi:hypothetical protein